MYQELAALPASLVLRPLLDAEQQFALVSHCAGEFNRVYSGAFLVNLLIRT